MDRVSFSTDYIKVNESAGTLELTVILERPPNLIRDVVVTVKTRDLMDSTSAKGY